MSESWLANAWRRLRRHGSADHAHHRQHPGGPGWERVEEILSAALELPTPDRSAFLDRCCAGEPVLRREVESLLAAHEASGPLDHPAAELVDSLFAPAALPAPGHTVSHYEILESLGSGGMGIVFQARDLRLGRLVALKFLSPQLSNHTRAQERFRIEARAAAALEHPNICAIHEIGETEAGQLFLAMPFYPGETLEQRIARGPLPWPAALRVAIQAARGLGRAHERGIVHRDIKPANLMLCEAAPAAAAGSGEHDGGLVRILDFGVAKLADISLTRPGTTPGTAAYMSPEQAGGNAVDHRADIWALGVVLYEMLTGLRPFRGEHEQAVVHGILHAEPEPVTALRPDVPAALSEIVGRALSKSPHRRHPGADVLARDLERVLEASAGSASVVASSAHDGQPLRPGSEHSGVLPQGERRQATIVVAALSGYTELVDRLVPDEVEWLIDRLRHEASEVAEHHGGILYRFSGEGLVLVFGVAATHEDDPRRGVRAAIELRERARELGRKDGEGTGQPVQLQLGIACGLAVAYPLDAADSGYRVTGAVTQVATRLAAEAGPGEIWISADCQRQARPFFDVEARPPLALRERAQPLTPYRVLGESGVQTRLEAAERAGLTAFVGRDRELEALRHSLRAAEAGEGQVVVVSGEAGMGKSRLLYELQQEIVAGPACVLRGRCQPYGGNISYLPFVEVLRNGLQVEEAEATDRSVESVVARIRAVAEELEEFVPLYLHLLSLRSERFPVPKHLHGDQFRLAMQEALAAILTLSARHRTVVLLLEDWHWADDASRTVLGQVAEMAPSYPMLVVVSCRPGSFAERDDAGVSATIPLRPLDAATAMRILELVTGADLIPDELGSLLYERAGGNPFFLEELGNALVEEREIRVEEGRLVLAGSRQTLQLPDSIQAVIRARLDRLEPGTREVVRLASVVGREFTRGVLEHCLPGGALLSEALQLLRGTGLIQQTRVVPDAAFRFKHALTQEVAYAGLLEHQRQELHGRVGEAIEQRHGIRLDAHLDRLAYHFSRAAKWQRAVHYGLRSAERASALSQFAEALQVLERVQGWLSHLPDGAERREYLSRTLLHQERLCESLGQRGRQQRIIDELIELSEPDGDRARLAEVYVRQGDLYTLLRRFDAAEAALQKSLRLRRELQDPLAERNTLRSLGLLRWHQGRHAEALEFIEAALTICRERNDVEALLGDVSNFANVLKSMGEHDRALEQLEQALALAESLQARDPATAAVFKQPYILHNLANIHRARGDNDRALTYLHRAVELTTGKRLPIQLSYHYTAIAHILLQQGRIEESLGYYRQSVELERRAQYAAGLAQSLRILGDVLLGLGRGSEALPYLEEAAEMFARLEDRRTEAQMWSRIASVREHAARLPEALSAWSRARMLFQEADDRRGEMEALEGLARGTRHHVGEPAMALGYYREALQAAQALGDRAAQGRLWNTIGILEWTRGSYTEALESYRRALEVYRALEEPEHVGLMLNSVGVTLQALGRRAEARARLEEALALHHREARPLLAGHALAALGDLHFEVGDTAEARGCYERSLRLRREVGDRRGEGWMLHHLARVGLARGLAGEAGERMAEAARIAKQCGDDELCSALERLGRDFAL